MIALLSDYVLCQRVKPPAGAAKEAQYSALLIVRALRAALDVHLQRHAAGADAVLWG